MPIKARPAVATEVLTVRVSKDTLALLDDYCRFLGGSTDRTYVVGEALRLVIGRDRRYTRTRRREDATTPSILTPARKTS